MLILIQQQWLILSHQSDFSKLAQATQAATE